MASLPTLDAFTSLGLLSLLAYVPHALKAYVILQRTGRYGLQNTRETVAKAVAVVGAETPDGRLIARLQSCHANHLEHFPIVAAAVLMAVAAGVDRGATDAAATAIVVARVAHAAAYAIGTPLVRSAAFVLGCVPLGYLMVAAATARSKTA